MQDSQTAAVRLLAPPAAGSGLWLSWLERAPDKGKVVGSTPSRPIGPMAGRGYQARAVGGAAIGGRGRPGRRLPPGGPRRAAGRTSPGDVAQLGERLVCNQQVGGSNPLVSMAFMLL